MVNVLIRSLFRIGFFILSICVLSHLNANLITPEQFELLNQYSRQSIKNFAFENYEISYVEGQGYFYIDSTRDWIKKRLHEGQIWEKHIVDLIYRYVSPNTVALDIGSHIGTHTIVLSRCIGDNGKVIAFEPQKKIYKELCMNLNLNCCKNVIPICAALGNQEGIAYLGKEDSDNEGGRFISFQHLIEPISMITLDQLGLKNISFIKMDVENYEGEVLKGAYKTIMVNRPIIIIEIGGGNIKQAEENIDSDEHLRKIINYFEVDLNYDISLIYGRDYLAIPR